MTADDIEFLIGLLGVVALVRAGAKFRKGELIEGSSQGKVAA